METRSESDILYGLRAVAQYLGLTENQAKHRAAAGQIPTFKMGGTVCASRSVLDQHIRRLAAQAS